MTHVLIIFLGAGAIVMPPQMTLPSRRSRAPYPSLSRRPTSTRASARATARTASRAVREAVNEMLYDARRRVERDL